MSLNYNYLIKPTTINFSILKVYYILVFKVQNNYLIANVGTHHP